MKNIIKTLIVMLTSVSLFSAAQAGDLNVSGTAKATYNIQSGYTSAGKGLGVTNELNFTASGELDNGYTWSYSMELDPGANDSTNNSADNDDTKLTMTTPYGTVGVFISEGGLDVEDTASQSVYARPTDIGDPSSTLDNYTIDSYNNLQYHTSADMLPYGVTFKIAHAPDLEAYGSGNNAGVKTEATTTNLGTDATEMQIKAAPIDGLKIGASYFEFEGGGVNKNDQTAESGAAFATYAIGGITAGYSRGVRTALLADGTTSAGATTVEYYDQENISAAFAVNDDLSVSYERETSELNYATSTTAKIEQQSKALQAAYTMGGMTLAISHAKHENNGYVEVNDTQQTLFAVTMAF